MVTGQIELSLENQQLEHQVRQLETDWTAKAARNPKKSWCAGTIEHFQPGYLTLHYELIQALADELSTGQK